ncbi:MAG: disulfide bond formation protein B [Burkholderiales bacterium]|nr:disulfide bond formation protein B [Burkholderiales bacterium]
MKRGILILVALACLGAVAGAYFTQHHWGMEPCPWCILQRILFLLIAALALIGALLPQRAIQMGVTALITATSAGGVAAALYQHFIAAKSSSCNLTFADKVIGTFHLDTLWPDMFEVRANCADAIAHLLGVPYEFWSLMLFVVVALAALWTLRSDA